MKPTLTRRDFLAAAALSAAGMAGARADGTPGPLRAGAAVRKITPGKDVRLDGTIMQIGPVKEVHDDLYARAIALDDGRTRLAVVLCDATMIERRISDEAKALIRKATGLSPENVLAAATHTHMAVRAVGTIAKTDADRAYHKLLARRIAEAVGAAVGGLAPAQVGWGGVSKPQYPRNRRWIMAEGAPMGNPFALPGDRVKMHGQPAKLRVKQAGPVDPQLSVLSLQHADGRPMALLANYSIHYAGFARGLVSADYFGAFADRIGRQLSDGDGGPAVVGIMSNGTSGDTGKPAGVKGGFEGIRQVGQDLADAAVGVCKNIQHRSRATLAVQQTELELGVRKPDADRLAWAKRLLSGVTEGRALSRPEVYAREAIFLSKMPPRVSVPLQAIRIGELGILALPCEVFAETGLAIKKHSPLKPTFTIGLANGYAGYLPPPAQHALGGYTTWPARSSYLEVEAEPKVRAAAIALLRKLV